MAQAARKFEVNSDGNKKSRLSELDFLPAYPCPVCKSLPGSKHSEKWDLLLLFEHIAHAHLGGFHIYNCATCDKRFVSEWVAKFHICKSDEFELLQRTIRDREKKAFLILQKTVNDAIRCQLDSLTTSDKDTVDRGIQIEINPVSRSIQTDFENNCSALNYSHLGDFFQKTESTTEDKGTDTTFLEEFSNDCTPIYFEENLPESVEKQEILDISETSTTELGTSNIDDGEICLSQSLGNKNSESPEIDHDNEVFESAQDKENESSGSEEKVGEKFSIVASRTAEEMEINNEDENDDEHDDEEEEEDGEEDGEEDEHEIDEEDDNDMAQNFSSGDNNERRIHTNSDCNDSENKENEADDDVPPAASPDVSHETSLDYCPSAFSDGTTPIPLSTPDSSQETLFGFDSNSSAPGSRESSRRRRRWDVRAAEGEPVVNKVKKSLLPGLCVPSLMDTKLSPLRTEAKPAIGEWTTLPGAELNHASDSTSKATTTNANTSGRNPSSSTANSEECQQWQTPSVKSGFFFNNPFLSCYTYGSNVTEYKKMQSRVQALVYQSVIGGTSDRPEGEEYRDKPYETWRPGYVISSNAEASSEEHTEAFDKQKIANPNNNNNLDDKIPVDQEFLNNSENYSSSGADDDRLVIDESDGELRDVDGISD